MLHMQCGVGVYPVCYVHNALVLLRYVDVEIDLNSLLSNPCLSTFVNISTATLFKLTRGCVSDAVHCWRATV